MNREPPLVFVLPLLLWSWQTGAWLPGMALAVWFEWSQRATWRWQIADKTLERLVDLTSLALVVLVLFEYSRAPLSAGIFSALRWSPVLLAPLLSAQVLSARDGISYRALFLSQRRSRSPEADQLLDLKPVYLVSALLAAGVGAQAQTPYGYLGGLLLLCLWVCAWQPRPAGRRQWALGLALLVLTGALAFVGQLALSQAQQRIEDLAVTWMSGLLWSDRDPYQARTALGDIGELKLSDRVLYRVTTETPLTQALLLRTAAYDRYVNTTWFSNEREFVAVPRVGDGWQWASGALSSVPSAASRGGGSLRIGSYLQRRGHLLPMPIGTWRLSDLPVESLERQLLGAVKASDGPPLIRYRADYSEGAGDDRPPQESDLRVPKPEQSVLQALVGELGLSDQNTATAIRRVREYFATHFRYSLQLPGSTPGQSAVEHFLTESQRGHCEFFASATVLLLRQAGVPARYAVGYSVQEPDGSPGKYRVRRSHAHAWALYWDAGRWHNLDTTPALWAELEADDRPFWQPVADLWSRLWYQFNLSRLEPGQSTPPWLWGVLALLFALLAYRLRLGERWRAGRERRKGEGAASLDSPLAPISEVLTRAGWPRRPGETDRQWLLRCQRTGRRAHGVPDVDVLLALNDRARFRPGGLNREETACLQTEVEQWLRTWKSGRPESDSERSPSAL
ncbi:transglutaminase family protein [Thiorhodovibrio frisius]|uniref:Transglutaminase-like enzyme, predicted cysteine protease n=1 Tax=Thiorhodovibrio frisius TaxID=631362 RepID=H8Z5N0_9GAMM|nr:transglutaminase domain-containing protein [Thiorhodovibrio frisius]EIC20600.1 transglutaminase-like enzyme, predicted cysteine protease [Thiorhodovibrio frisius]WPL21349.1 Protein-glutamine gamma-glutamyltransferase [Thiorhodovibrio frisius]